MPGRRFRSLAIAFAVASLAGTSSTFEVLATGPGAKISSPRLNRAAATTTAPGVPFVASVAPRGLAALLTWEPNPTNDRVTSFTAAANANSSPVPAGCACPTAHQRAGNR